MRSTIIVLTIMFVLFAVTMVKTHKNTKKVCKTQSTYMIDGTTYSCDGI